mmetsp:Transcript_43886/g.69760  ORF Transcript_43886/g.69760 Transcript_43886/m.69760 type:complete len:210 (-) Transcript_43886:118-747(-)
MATPVPHDVGFQICLAVLGIAVDHKNFSTFQKLRSHRHLRSVRRPEALQDSEGSLPQHPRPRSRLLWASCTFVSILTLTLHLDLGLHTSTCQGISCALHQELTQVLVGIGITPLLVIPKSFHSAREAQGVSKFVLLGGDDLCCPNLHDEAMRRRIQHRIRLGLGPSTPAPHPTGHTMWVIALEMWPQLSTHLLELVHTKTGANSANCNH